MHAPERLTDEDPEADQPPGLIERTAGWAACAAGAVMATLLVANTPSGAIRIDQALKTLTDRPNGIRVAINAPSRSVQPVDNDHEIAEAMRRLAADRDQLAIRVGTLERSLDDITGSIRSQKRPAKAASVPHEPVALEPFGVELGSAQNLSGARNLWNTMRKRFKPLLSDIEPIVSVHETEDGKNELRLVAGPLEDARAATRLCASLGVAGASCAMAVYAGQPLTPR